MYTGVKKRQVKYIYAQPNPKKQQIGNRNILPSRKSRIPDGSLFVFFTTESRSFTHNAGSRQDLFYRINTFEIHVPPLRERLEDIPELTEYFLAHLKKKYNKPALTVNKRVIEQLQKYNWPGNIRELKNALERAVILSENNNLEIKHFSLNPGNELHEKANRKLASFLESIKDKDLTTRSVSGFFRI